MRQRLPRRCSGRDKERIFSKKNRVACQLRGKCRSAVQNSTDPALVAFSISNI